MVPHITQKEKQTRRDRTKAKRRRCGKKRRALPKARKGADGPFKEFKIVTLYDDAGEHRVVTVTRGDCTEAGRLMRRDAGRVGLDKADDKVGVVDGSDWIKNQIQLQSLPLDDLGLDFYHLSENIHKARRVVFGEEDPKDKQAPGSVWVSTMLHVAKHEGYEKLRDDLQKWKGTLQGTSHLKAAEQVLNYVTDRREMIQYPKFIDLGRQIGSGPTESMCKATTQRIKGGGKRWDADNAESIMAAGKPLSKVAAGGLTGTPSFSQPFEPPRKFAPPNARRARLDPQRGQDGPFPLARSRAGAPEALPDTLEHVNL